MTGFVDFAGSPSAVGQPCEPRRPGQAAQSGSFQGRGRWQAGDLCFCLPWMGRRQRRDAKRCASSSLAMRLDWAERQLRLGAQVLAQALAQSLTLRLGAN